ncbi:MAG: MFS transporter [Candidatus Thermoplasmatota archaeon]|nr:MFS transporter [Candidatus Thermoplasmatota archaeon]
MVQYKWIALSNTTLGVLMATINGTIILISLPAIFNGLGVNPFSPSSFVYLLWILMGYGVITAVLLVTAGRLSDIFGRVRLFNFGFLIFTIGSILLYITPGKGDTGAMELIIFRMIQAIGASFLFANSAAIITDSFPSKERGKAMGINQIAALAGSLVGLILGGILSAIHYIYTFSLFGTKLTLVFDWRLVFLVSVPVGILGTVWSYWKLKDNAVRHKDQKVDIPGNVTFASGLTLLLLGVTYGLMPYGSSSMGWGDPWVLASMLVGAGLLVVFVIVESFVSQPMFKMNLFRTRQFAFGSIAGMLQSMGMGGVMFMMIILLQGVWLPLHLPANVPFSQIPFYAGIYMIPMMAGFVIFGPISGAISDKIGARLLGTVGMLLGAAAFLIFTTFTYNFSYPEFGATLFLMGAGMGLFAAPNITAVMNSVAPQERGAASGMRTTLQNTGQTASMGIFFTIVLIGLSTRLGPSFATSLQTAGAPILIPVFNKIPATSALFSAFLGYNPMQVILSFLPSTFSSLLSPSALATLYSKHWFPLALAPAFMSSLDDSFYIGAALFVAAALLSAFRGKRYIHGEEVSPAPQVPKPVTAPSSSQAREPSGDSAKIIKETPTAGGGNNP